MAMSAGNLTFALPASILIELRKQADQPAANSCSGLVPLPEPGGDSLISNEAGLRPGEMYCQSGRVA